MTDQPESERDQPADVIWSAREALACALCWAEFHDPEDREDTPEQYWLSIHPKSRASCRQWANKLLLLAVARGQAVAILPPLQWRDSDLELVGANARLTAKHRIYQIVDAVWNAAKTIRDVR